MVSPKVCVSLYGSTDDIMEGIRSTPEADLYEVRIDLSDNPDLASIFAKRNKPLIIASHEKPSLLEDVKHLADFVDVGPNPPQTQNEIFSLHTGDLADVEFDPLFKKNSITKIVIGTENYRKIQDLIQLNEKYAPRAVCFASGETGSFSRILSVLKGARWIYTCLEGRQTAAGQFDYPALMDVYRIKRFKKGPLAVFGIIGNPVRHSASPEFHNARFAAEELPWIYLPFHCNDLPSLIEAAPGFGVKGFSITHPYKQQILSLIDQFDTSVSISWNCNTIRYDSGKWYGINTDVLGINHLLKSSGISVQGKRVVILGAGGAACAVASIVGAEAAQTVILNRSRKKAKEMAQRFGVSSGHLEDFRDCRYDILFQTTSCGLILGESPVDTAWLKPDTTIIESIYNPPETTLLQAAKLLGCRAINGQQWFEAQALAQFDWWKQHVNHGDH